ncbi:VWA domain-containing protein [Cryobacterium glaciale]|uniref:VWA domain-containing protein n=1 Tax=Cryobacterium glaciale TaxID=1259145 RepID=A0A4R8URQ5_9MICO|nr:VWA domain-containing protein [Cryobacterium glaciale]TFB69022.1 VWA domain-containing protein [Cryobacterium glaciale]
MSASGAAPTPRRRAALIMIAAGLVVTLALLSSVVWFLMDGRNSAAAGTLDGLDDAGSAGSWHAVEPFSVGSDDLVAGAATAFTIDRADASLPTDTTSVLLQLEIVPGAEAGGIVTGAEQDSSTVSFSANTPVTTSQLVLLDADGTVTLTADQTVAVTLTLFAYLQAAEKNEPSVGPGGSAAIAPRPVIDTNTGLGGTLAALDTPITLSPQGLGAVPTEGVAAVWLQVALLGLDARLSLPTTGPDNAPVVLQSVGAFTNALVLVPLDDRGLFQWRFSGTVDQVRASVTGWVAGQGRSLDAATIPGGLVPVAAANLNPANLNPANLDTAGLTPTLPTGAVGAVVGSALYSVQVTSPTPGTVSADAGESRADDRRETTLPVRGAASTLVIAGPGGTISLPDGAIADSLTLLGYFPTAVEPAGSAPGVSITEPAADGSIDLGDAGGTFVIHGTITQADAGVQLVEVRLGSRSIGSARVDATVSPPLWSIETSATPGDHEVSVTVTDWAGQTGQAAVAFTVEAPAESVAIANNRTVVLDGGSLALASDVTASSISFSGLSPAVVGEFIVAGVSEATPEGIMREVTAVELVDGLVVVTTRPAAFGDIVLQADVRVVDQQVIPVGSAPTAAPASDRSTEQTGPTVLPASYAKTNEAVAATDTDLAESKRVGVVDLSTTVSVTTAPEVSVEYESKSADLKLNIKASAESVEASGSVGDVKLAQPTSSPTPSPTAVPATPTKPKFTSEAGVTLGVAFELVTRATMTVKIAPVWKWTFDVATVLERFESSTKQQQTQTIEVSSYGAIAVTYGSKRKRTNLGQYPSPIHVNVAELPHISLGQLVGVIPTPVPIPWVLTFNLVTQFDLSLSLTGTTTYTSVERITREMGVRLENGKIEKFSSTTTEVAPTVWTSELEVKLAAKLALSIDAMVYDMAGIYFGVEIAPTLTAGSTSKFETGKPATVVFASKFVIVVSLVAGVKLEVFNKELINWEAKRWQLVKKVYWDVDTEDESPAGTGDPVNAPGSDPDTATGTGNRALLVVVDLSGSMLGERVEKAQDALTQLVMSQPLGSEMGIWTYGGSCEQSGDYAIEVAPVMGTGDLVTEIASFEAGGGTPTAEALLAATKQLQDDGNTGATVVLVSDGESGCDDPCEAAAQIRAQGFDLQVQSVGFQTSAAGETELECIAEKTDGTYTSVEDVDALADKLAALGRASIDLTVAAGDTILANQAQNIDVTVTNPSGRDAADITVALTFPSGDLVPLVSPSPQLLFGNLPPGASSTQSVQLYSTVQDAVGSTDYRVIAWGAEVDAVIVEGSYETLRERTEPIEPGPILADAAASDYPAALVGDGLASGDTGCEADDAKAGGYASALAVTTEPVVLACAGTSGNNLLGSEASTGAGNQLERLAAEPAVSEVVVSVGAADVGLDSLLELCASSGCALDDPAVRTVIGKAQELDLGPVYRSIWATVNTEQALEARGGVHAPVIVTAYPQLFANDRALDCTTEWGRSEAQVGHTVIAYLNAALETAALRVAADGYEVYFAAGPEDSLHPNHTLCDDDSFVMTTDDGQLVPSADGLAAAGDALLLWSQNRPRTAPTASALGSAESYAVPAPGLVKSVGRAVSGLANPTKSVDLAATGPAVHVAPGQQVRVTGAGFLPGSPVVVSLSGDPSILGTTTADADGRADLTAIVPQHTALGTATVSMNGAQMSGASTNDAASGVELELVRELRIGALVPIWIVATVFGGLLLLLAAIGLALLARRLARSAPRRLALSKPAAGPRT